MADHVDDLLKQVRQAIGLFVTTSASSAVTSTVDRIEFTTAVAAWLWLVWKLETLVLEHLQRGDETYMTLLRTVLLQVESVLMFLIVKDVHDLAVSSTAGSTSSQTSTLVCVAVFVGVDGIVKASSRRRQVKKENKDACTPAGAAPPPSPPSCPPMTALQHQERHRTNFFHFSFMMVVTGLCFAVLQSNAMALTCAQIWMVALWWSMGYWQGILHMYLCALVVGAVALLLHSSGASWWIYVPVAVGGLVAYYWEWVLYAAAIFLLGAGVYFGVYLVGAGVGWSLAAGAGSCVLVAATAAGLAW